MVAPALSPPLFGPDYYQNPYPAFDWLRIHSPVHEFRFPAGDVPTFFVSRFADVKALLADNRFSTAGASWANDAARAAGLVFGEGTVVESIVTVLDPPDHTRVRKLAMGAFTPRRIAQWQETVERITERALDRLAESGEADIMKFAATIPAEVLGEVLGLSLEKFQEVLHAIDRAFSTDPDLEDDRKRAFNEVGEYGRELIADKRRNPGEDLTSTFIAARDGDDRFGEPELLAMISVMIMAGLDTTRGVIGSASLALIDFPDQLKLLQDNPELAPGAVEEFLRYEGALSTTLFRFAKEDAEFNGVFIPKGSPVLASSLSANRDPEQFEAPDRLDITRTGVRHLGFGHGLHNCLGAALARLEVGTSVPALFRRFPQLRLSVPREDVRWVESWLVRSPAALPVELGPAAS
ncbi:cytochrome P450 [Saccharothrix violaceirubra]|uniref:Cytochrome P450 n=1 Tax=Saccharothrix violaceirubra TaxID=413306 RepID=A0A7W7T497_9PSEU|nr:cytochrome P450 [Saccharothrix violaceirubra]MBB4966314.1 cytochrome P450 [Saccharothrix violaceirubra]